MPKILIIDDDKLITAMLETTLQKHGYETATAHDGSEGLEKSSTETPDMIVLDYSMPGMNGEEVLKTLKSTDSTKNIPVIMLTANDDNKYISSSLQIGAADYIVKPFDPEIMLIRLERLLKK